MTNELDDQYNSGPAYKQPWFWLIMAPLIASIIVGTSMLVYSIVVYQGKAVDQFSTDRFDLMPMFEREQKAQSLNIKAMSWLEGEKLSVNLTGAFETKPEKLLLTIFSPVSKQQDVEVDLIFDGEVYFSNVDLRELPIRTMQIVNPEDPSWLIQAKQTWPFKEKIQFTAYLPTK